MTYFLLICLSIFNMTASHVNTTNNPKNRMHEITTLESVVTVTSEETTVTSEETTVTSEETTVTSEETTVTSEETTVTTDESNPVVIEVTPMQDINQCVVINGVMLCVDICGGRSEFGTVCSYE